MTFYKYLNECTVKNITEAEFLEVLEEAVTEEAGEQNVIYYDKDGKKIAEKIY